ncbi:MAG: VIT1/CCC1 family protein [Bacteroidia bacterium]|nr:VIT1/CCC1 family protein [Bacteroidia bacterium]
MPIHLALRYASEELFNTHLYEWLAQTTKNPRMREILLSFASQERSHYTFWQQWLSEKATYPKWRFWWYKILLWLFGISFVLRLLELKEHQTIEAYRRLLPTLPPEPQSTLHRLIEDEEKHEAEFINAIRAEEPRLKYAGFIILGLSDAIIEVTGVHAGFLGMSHRPLAAGLAGLIVGFAASISMASAAYLQAKQNPSISPLSSALYTGISYIVAVVILALPYFSFPSTKAAFWWSVLLAVMMVLAFMYYSSVIFERSFRQEAVESLVVLSATCILSYGFGEGLRYFFADALQLFF